MYQMRPIRQEDAVPVCRLSKQLGYILTERQTFDNITRVLKDPKHLALVALDGDLIIGWVHAFETATLESEPFIELAGLVVDEDYRSKGIGNLLVSRIKEWCASMTIATLRVRSNVIRINAHRFYINQGFEELKQQKVFQYLIK